jgi:hypothetical protein
VVDVTQTNVQRVVVTGLTGIADDELANGRVIATSGQNLNDKVMIAKNTNQVGSKMLVYLKEAFGFPLEEDDTVTIIQGCMKTLSACQSYDNAPAFDGEPFVPSGDVVGRRLPPI